MDWSTDLADGTPEALKEMLNPIVDVANIEGESDIEKINERAFELYKEALGVVNLASHLYDDQAASSGGWQRDQAICAALMIRICKFMVAVIQLSSKGNRAEIVSALNRSILETAVNLEFLVSIADKRSFDNFVTKSLGPERELYDLIQSNITERGGEILPIETRMLNSINDVCQFSGLKIEEVDRKHGDWAGGVRARLKALGKEEQYTAMIRVPSHAIHGNWVDLYKNHLYVDKNSGLFSPKSDFTYVDERHLGPIAVLVLEATRAYLSRFFSAVPEIRLVLERVDDVIGRIILVGKAHENLLIAKNESQEVTPNC